MKTIAKKGPLKKAPVKKLPKTFRGAPVVRGRGMDMEAFEELVETRALDQFDATRETFLVLDDRALAYVSGSEVRCFSDKNIALRCARALGNGNVDQRVLRVCGQILVVATENESPRARRGGL